MSKFSSGLVNYVESVNINGYKKTVFYSDFATNLVVGDKVFIINGNYDSDLLINSSNFTSGTDGYTVLDIDRCRITLDIDYTGVIPSNIDTLDNYIKVYNVTSQREFDYINTLTTNSYSGHIYSKFERELSNNIIYANDIFIGGTSVIDSYNSVTPGFYQKTTLSPVSLWTPISLLSGTSSILFSTSYSLTNNGKLLIIGKDDIIIGSTTLKSRGIYTFNNIRNKWEFDISSNKPYISKLNFRKGKFNGVWNDGVFGTYLDQIDWYGNAKWNSGIFINSNWKNGNLYSKTDTTFNTNINSNTSLSDAKFNSIAVSNPIAISSISATVSRTVNYNITNTSNNLNPNYYCKLNSNGIPVQTSDYSNNSGHGFNYIIDSNIEQAVISNGNFKNCNIGLTNYGVNALDVYYGLSFSYNISSKGGYYELCDINTSLLTNSFIQNSNISNSNINNGRLSSNQIDNTVAQVTYNSDNGITILNADLWSYLIGTTKRGVLKLFISDDDLSKLQDFEVIYINKINKELYLTSFNDENKVYLNLENKYIFDYFNNSEISSVPIIISRKNINENLYKTYISYSLGSFNTQFISNPTKFASIDIDLGNDLAYYKDLSTGVYTYINPNSLINVNNVSNLFSNIVLSNSNFNSGLLLNSNWESGDNFNDIGNKIKLVGSNLDITFIPGTTNSLYVNISNNIYNQYDLLNIGDYVWLDGIDYIDPYSNVTAISGTYKILYVDTTYTSYRQLELIEVTNVLNGLTIGGTFSISGVLPNYVSINKFKLDKSNIQSGLFKSTLITNSKIFNSKFDNTDQNLTISNINRLRFINTIVNKNNNLIQSGYFYKSHIIDANWQNAIAFNSIWAGATFSNGVFNNGYWLNGIFDNGYIINADDISTTLPSYDDSTTGYYRSWRYGIFNNGQFYKSTWIDGVFNNGRLFNSHWYGGIWNNGILGLKNTPYLITTMGYYSNLGVGATQTYWNNGVVESATIGGSSSVYWYKGSFNDGGFTSFGYGAESIWYNGTFNGGKFDGLAKWKNGTFNNGKFISHYGWTLSNISHYSTNISNYGSGFSIGDTFSISGGDNNSFGEITSVSNASGLIIKVETIGTFNGSGFVFKSLTVDSSGHIITSTASPRGTGYTVGELFAINNTFSTAPAYGKITAIDGFGGVLGYTLSFTGLSYTNSTTYSTTLYSGSYGTISTISINSGGFGYLPGDNFVIYNSGYGTGLATGQVLTVGSLGNALTANITSIGARSYTNSNTYSTGLLSDSTGHVLTYNISNKGTGYSIGTYSTIPSLSSFGTDFIINIASLDTYINVSDASWENGIFNNGEFGLASTSTNSVWYNGQFNGGIFKGRIWNSGIFTNGQFIGSSLTASYKNEVNFINSYINNYYGVWLDGYVVPQPHIGNSSQKVYTNILRATDTKKLKSSVTLQNMLWINGTFSHENAIMYNSLWLNGSFNYGQFNYSAFNPFVDRNLSGSTTSLSFNFDNSCVWVNGQFNNSTFYISEWQNGTFNSGYMLGGIWRKGTWNYGTAENIYWESGLWRNGNWFGTNFGISTLNDVLSITDPMAKSVIYNVALASNNNSIHLMNVFTGSSPEILFSSDMSNTLGWNTTSATEWYQSATYSETTYDITGYHFYSFGGLIHSVPYYGWVSHIYTDSNYKLIHLNNYSSTTPISSNLLYGKKFDTYLGYTDNIFTDFAAYTIKVSVHIDYPQNMTNPVYIDLWMGYTMSTFACTKGSNPVLVKSYTNQEVYDWTGGLTYTKFGIGKRSSNTYVEEVAILNVTINETLISYNPVYNNKLYNIYGASASTLLSSTISLPTNITTTSDAGISLNYGNGMFYSGIWENGIWENGYRDDNTLSYCELYPIASYLKIDKFTHRVQLKFLNATSIFNIGDYVSAGNLIGIDVNGERKLLKDKFKVVYVDVETIVLEYTLTSPILEITKDSTNHLIYISKNVWLSGGFLSGYFNGIWNYGLFKGYPYITKMKDSHWVDGIFDGGHFISSIGTVSNSITSDLVTYNTGLVQNFTFKDNNIGSNSAPVYQSWIDVNYSTQSQVNLNKKSTIFSTFVSGGGGEYPYTYNTQNIYGSPTYDVLSSNSYFKISNSSINYTLGSKSRKYNNLIPDGGNFENPASSTNAYIGLDNFLNNSWTYSNTYGITDVESNITESSSEVLNLHGGELILTNTNVKLNAESNRYYQVDMTFTTANPATNIRILNTSYNESLGWDASPASFNHASTSTLTKTEYFYNKKSFDLYMYSGLSASITNISFNEVDMIPFLQYATESNIDQTIYYPYTAVAPYIDYTNANYNYVGNISLNIDTNTIGNSSSVYNPVNSGNIFIANNAAAAMLSLSPILP